MAEVAPQELVDPESTYATTKEEEWVTKKKTELTTTRQIETRVKRQVVLEDGKVVDDSGPIVTTNTTEDTEKQESKQTEDYLTAVKSQQDIRLALLEGREDNQQVVSTTGPRVVHQATKSHKVIDTEDSQELSQLQPDGRLVTETRRTTEHEEVHDTEEPDGGEESDAEETFKESSSRYNKTKDQDLIEYLADGVKIGEEMRYVAENIEGERRGDPDLAEREWDSLSTRIRRMRRQSAKTRGIPHFGEPAPVAPLDRKDALTKKPLDFDQEEETRKAETSKWLEHHFGSDSRSSLEDDDLQAAGTNTSFINVTMKSRPISSNRKASSMTSPNNGNTTTSTPKSYVATVNTSSRVFVSSPEPEDPPSNGAGGYFQGVSEWSERSKDVRSQAAPQRPERVQVLPTGPHHTFTTKTAEVGFNSHVDRTSPYQHTNHVSEKTSLFQASRSSSQLSSFPTPYNKTVRVPCNESPLEDDDHLPSRQRLRFTDREEPECYQSSLEIRPWGRGGEEEEPPPDYSPEQPSPSPSPPPDIRATPPPETTSSKKFYRRPRINAEIPPPPSPTPTGRHGKSGGHSATSIIGESFRKLVGKFRTSSSERKAKRKNLGGKRGTNSSRSPSPRHHHVTDSKARGSEELPLPNEAGLRQAEGGESGDQPVAPPRSTRALHYRARGEPAMQRRFYLGEDPFGGSIYGREREYDGVTPLKSSRRHHRRGEEDDMNRANISSSSTLGRLSKSTSRLAPAEQVTSGTTLDYSRTAQTLPRKLYDEHTQTSRLKKQVYLQKNGGTKQPHSGSMINVSIINNVTPPPSSLGVTASTGPAKPARTYRSNLARSKSFNVHAGEPGDSPSFHFGNTSTIYKSNPHLHRLDESPPPLKSPGILASISRSQRDLSDSTATEKEEKQEHQNKFSKSTSNLITNGYGSAQEAKKRLFMRELMDKAPELYKTLHGSDEDNDLKQSDRRVMKNGLSNSRVLDYSSSFRSSSTNATPPESNGGRSPFRPSMVNGGERVTSPCGSKSSFSSSMTHTPSYSNGARRGSSSNDDYSETVRITSKLDDPVRPSVTNTVQSFSKKTIPRKGGLSTETIESSETTTVTKSRFGSGSPQNLDTGDGKYPTRNGAGGVVIEVRPTRK
ncbi:uncharacterized protein chas isoform X2 [Anabrus simplex]|uniref:uncharacterized protein chas isoform X2 n=1 Tax=Anabrus simplex TaxID=316456 RepID=UPI0035A33E33